MRRGSPEEIFHECLQAYLEGRRTIEESLSLYPRLADKLEPLLRTATELTALGDYRPPFAFQEETRQRFLAAARQRRLLRGLYGRTEGLPANRWLMAGAVVAAVVLALALAGGTVLEDSERQPQQVEVRLLPPSPSAAASAGLTPQLERVRGQLATLEALVQQGKPIPTGMIRDIKETSSRIASHLEDPAALDDADRDEVVSLASEEYHLLSMARDQVAPTGEQEIDQALGLAGAMLDKLGVPQPSPTAAASPTAEPTVTPTPSPTNSPTLTPAGTPEP